MLMSAREHVFALSVLIFTFYKIVCLFFTRPDVHSSREKKSMWKVFRLLKNKDVILKVLRDFILKVGDMNCVTWSKFDRRADCQVCA